MSSVIICYMVDNIPRSVNLKKRHVEFLKRRKDITLSTYVQILIDDLIEDEKKTKEIQDFQSGSRE